tara:strand:+ start:2397 stop:2651 length:255 start_codon:yes stop_codon:yes gene_type:complete
VVQYAALLVAFDSHSTALLARTPARSVARLQPRHLVHVGLHIVDYFEMAIVPATYAAGVGVLVVDAAGSAVARAPQPNHAASTA